MRYFGTWADPDAALKKYLDQKDDLHAGRQVRTPSKEATVKDVANAFLNTKQPAVDTKELSPRTWAGYKTACDLMVKEFGRSRLVADLTPEDFASLRDRLASRYGPHGLGTAIQSIRCCCKHAYESGQIDRPVRYGPGFKRPSKKTLRLHRAAQGPKLFTAENVRKLIDAAGQPLKAMLLLGINCGFGNSDCGTLPRSAIDFEIGWIDFPRPKTGIPRRCPLWRETLADIEEAVAVRRVPRSDEHTGLIFLTSRGHPWAKTTNDCPIAKETAKLLRRLGISGSFYWLRHTFRTVADGAKDQPAADHIMGHEVAHMSSVYRETISDERLKAVSDHVRHWLFPDAPEPTEPRDGP
jgi:integrase